MFRITTRLQRLPALGMCACLLLPLLLGTSNLIAQPSLPEIAATSENKDVIITWQNQYDKVKVITVMRSNDSMTDFEIIGYVKKPAKGINSYNDKKVPPGKYYYKLAIVFGSGLNWRSNLASVVVAPPVREKPKDEPQKETEIRQEPKNKATTPPTAQLESSFKENNSAAKAPDTAKKTTHAAPAVALTFASDSNLSARQAPARHKIHYSYDEITDNTPIFIRSKYIYSDTATGHVRLDLPEDLETHHYSVKFYDKDKHVIIEVPRLNSTKIILDKRNFQHKGVYKFVLRKDYTELESGFITVVPSGK